MKFFLAFLITISLCYGEFKNALIHETSPYLTQHAHNPVNWYAWNKASLAKAKKEHKPIFLSIGYSTCHWCHVMARESFEDEKIAALINKDFIAIKVDREELPHLDKYYQRLYTLLKNRSGGWPLNAFLTEDAKAFYVATYIPPSEKYNIQGLDTLLPELSQKYKDSRQELIDLSYELERKIRQQDRVTLKPVSMDLSIMNETFEGLKRDYDELYHGFSIQPKFPEPSKIKLLFDLDSLGVEGAKEMALNVLRAMALGGIYDQVEGGFFRYSVDAAWEIPHFEKMLYTSAELIPLYLKAYGLTQDPLYKEVVVESIKMIEKRFEVDDVYMSASDADSNHLEGSYFIYTYEELLQSMSSLTKEEKASLIEGLDLSEIGNFILEDESETSYTHINFYGKNKPISFKKIQPALEKLRGTRTYPFIDKKINTAWNAMMIEALFSSASFDKKYLALAEKRVHALLRDMYKKGILYHQRLLGNEAVQKAILEDYAFMISTLIEAYAQTYDKKYLYLAKTLADKAIEMFYDGTFWFLSADGIKVYADMQDKYYTAPLNKILFSLLKLASLSEKREYLDIVEKSLDIYSIRLSKNPASYASALQVLLAKKRSFITLKSSKNQLEKNKKRISNIDYPYLLNKADNSLNSYLACDMMQCFAIDKEIDEVIKIIEQR